MPQIACTAPLALSRRQWLGAGLATAALAIAGPVQAKRVRRAQSATAPTRPAYPLAAGMHYWMPALSPAGPVVAAVNLHTQLLQLYRNGVAIGFAHVSSGKQGHSTPVGLFTVLEKQRFHRSNLYNNAPMPYMVRLTWSGVALHGGAQPGYPASHGCIRLPHAFASQVFGTIRMGEPVLVVRQETRSGIGAVGMLAPIEADGQALLLPEALSQPAYWAEQRLLSNAPHAQPPLMPVSLLASLQQQRLFVLRNGCLVAALALPALDLPPGLPAHSLLHWHAAHQGAGQWQAATTAFAEADSWVWQQLLQTLPGPGQQRLRTLLNPGATLLLTDMPAVNDVHVAAWNV